MSLNPASQHVLLLGAAGFLGRHVTEALETRGATVTATARRATAHLRALELSDAAAVREIIAELRPAAIINCAGRTAGSLSELVRDNAQSVATLIEAIQAISPETRLVQFGSAAEYGPSQGQDPVLETDPPRPEAAYGITKLAGTQLVTAESRAGRLVGVVLRVFNPIGAGMPEGGLPGRAAGLIRAALQSGADQITLGSLEAYRDFVDARDVAEAAALAALNPECPQGVLNIASGEATQVRALVRTLAVVAGFGGEVLESASGSPRSGGVSWQQANIQRGRNVLGWTPRFELRSSLERLWQGGQ